MLIKDKYSSLRSRSVRDVEKKSYEIDARSLSFCFFEAIDF